MTLVLCCLVSLFVTIQSLEVPTKIVAGAFWKELPDSIIYEASIPLTYTTSWDSTPPKYIDLHDAHCESECMLFNDTKNIAILSSELDQHFAQIQMSLDPKLFIEEDKPTSRNKRELKFIGNFFSWCCGLATEEKLNSLAIKSHLYKAKLEQLNRGVHSQFSDLVQQNTLFKNFNDKMKSNFDNLVARIKIYEKKAKNIRIAATTAYEDHLNVHSMNSFNNMRRLVYFTQLFRNNEILNACKNHFIPTPILPPNILKIDLKNLDDKIKSFDHTLVIPLNELSRYYKIPITDCSIADDKIIVHVKVPVKSIERDWKLLELLTTPFSWKGETCVVMHDTMYLAVSGDIMRPISGAGLHQCKPYHDKLCYLSRFASDVKYGPQCAFKMYTGATVNELNKHCTFRCHPSDAMLISEVNLDTYVITHIKNKTYTICNGKINYFPYSVYEKPGAVQLHLPCNCILYVNDKIMIPARFPCEESSYSLNITHILPITWSNLKSFKFHPLKLDHYPEYSNMSECLNLNWTVTVPHLNLSTYKDNFDIEEIEESLFSNYIDYAPHSDTLFLIWNSVLSIIVFIIWNRGNMAIGANLLNALPAVRADIPNHVFKFGSFPIIGITILFFIIFIGSFAIYRYFKQRRQKLNNPEPEDVPLNIIHSTQFNSAVLSLPDGRKFEVNLISNNYNQMNNLF